MKKKPSPREAKNNRKTWRKIKREAKSVKHELSSLRAKLDEKINTIQDLKFKFSNEMGDMREKLEKAKLHFKEIKYMNRDTDNAEFVFKKAKEIAEQALKELA